MLKYCLLAGALALVQHHLALRAAIARLAAGAPAKVSVALRVLIKRNS